MLNATVSLFSDEAETEPLDLTGYTVEVVLEPASLGENGPVTLTGGLGFPAGRKGGEVQIFQAIDTPTFDVGLGHWFMKLADATGKVTYPFSGKLIVGRP